MQDCFCWSWHGDDDGHEVTTKSLENSSGHGQCLEFDKGPIFYPGFLMCGCIVWMQQRHTKKNWSIHLCGARKTLFEKNWSIHLCSARKTLFQKKETIPLGTRGFDRASDLWRDKNIALATGNSSLLFPTQPWQQMYMTTNKVTVQPISL
jgi:hypothetical protein